ncbi:hypothetical protein KTR66_02995 [Roseococcus sp. SDR]|uniref:hypothetical protein n=1 Tax=Roseococcus sp. SDR TaxID=2835532 RepID=UPI001BD15D9A|nr:hypothetical protein [Roseococcus sp. SDR]MBS7788944.1 hypothetical protein [Roseococcus sp. SDR]MBV1844258.1 hypothetical protein [Roseococcus sp. SDR]
MAFLIPIEINDTGAFAEYWRLTHVQVDRVAGVVEAQLHGYRDEAARRAGKAPLQRLSFRFDQAAMEDPYTLAVEDLYRTIRLQPEGEGAPSRFATATDI